MAAPAGTSSEPPDGEAAPSLLRRLLARVRSPRGRILVVAVAAVLVIAAVTTAFVATTGVTPSAATPPAATIEPSTASSASPPVSATPAPATAGSGSGSGSTVDPTSAKAVAFLKALRQAKVPVSPSGLQETEAAEAICEQLAGGTDSQTLVQEVPALLPTAPEANANDVVTAASKTYC